MTVRYAVWIRLLKNGGDPFYFKIFGYISSLNLLPEIKLKCIRKRIKDDNFHLASSDTSSESVECFPLSPSRLSSRWKFLTNITGTVMVDLFPKVDMVYGFTLHHPTPVLSVLSVFHSVHPDSAPGGSSSLTLQGLSWLIYFQKLIWFMVSADAIISHEVDGFTTAGV